MIDTKTRKPLKVSAAGTTHPYITLPYHQVLEVRRALDKYQVLYRVAENVISLNGGPEMAIVALGRGQDADAVQAILDGVIWQ